MRRNERRAGSAKRAGPFLIPAFLIAAMPMGVAQGAGYTYETAVLSPDESWESSQPHASGMRLGQYVNLTMNGTGTLSVPYRIGIRFPGSFQCLLDHEIDVQVGHGRGEIVERNWSNESIEPVEKTILTFPLPAGSYPQGKDWEYQEGPAFVIRWNLSRLPESGFGLYWVTASPTPRAGPEDCLPKGPSVGSAYLSRLNVSAAIPPAGDAISETSEREARGLGFPPWGAAVAGGVSVALLLKRRNERNERA